MNAPLTESKRDPARAVLDQTIAAGEPWLRRIAEGQVLRIEDLQGNQSVDTVFFAADDADEHYSLTHTIQAQGALYLGVGSKLMSSEGRTMLTIVADTCGLSWLSPDSSTLSLTRFIPLGTPGIAFPLFQ